MSRLNDIDYALIIDALHNQANANRAEMEAAVQRNDFDTVQDLALSNARMKETYNKIVDRRQNRAAA